MNNDLLGYSDYVKFFAPYWTQGLFLTGPTACGKGFTMSNELAKIQAKVIILVVKKHPCGAATCKVLKGPHRGEIFTMDVTYATSWWPCLCKTGNRLYWCLKPIR